MAPIRVRALPYHRDWEICVLIFLDHYISEMLPRSLRKTLFANCEAIKKLFKKMYDSKRWRKNLQLQIFQSKCSKKRDVMGLRSGRSLSKVYSS